MAANHHYRKPPAHHFTDSQRPPEREPGPGGRPAVIRVEHDGKSVTLHELSKATGMPYRRLLKRYHSGRRGAELVQERLVRKRVTPSYAERRRGLL